MPRSQQADQNTPVTNHKQEYRFVLRLPYGYHEQLAAISRRNRRSMNSEITLLLEEFVARDGALIASDRIGLAPVNSHLNETALRLIEKFQQLSSEKKKALLDLLE